MVVVGNDDKHPPTTPQHVGGRGAIQQDTTVRRIGNRSSADLGGSSNDLGLGVACRCLITWLATQRLKTDVGKGFLGTKMVQE